MPTFTPMTIQRLAVHLVDENDDERRWLLLLEFLEEYEHEPSTQHRSLVEAEPARTGDAHWDALLAGIVEWLAAREEYPPLWVDAPERTLRETWSPHGLPSLRRLACDNAPLEIRRHGVLIDPYDLARA